MLLAQIGEDRIKITNELHVNFALFIGGKLIPARLRPIAVVIPLEKGDIVFGEELVEKALDVVAHIGASELKNKLVALLGTRASGKIQNPIGMLAIEIGIGVDHLRLDP